MNEQRGERETKLREAARARAETIVFQLDQYLSALMHGSPTYETSRASLVSALQFALEQFGNAEAEGQVMIRDPIEQAAIEEPEDE